MNDRTPTNGPGLNEANAARQRAHRVPPKPAIIGGVDEPGLRPLTRGEKTHPFMAADGTHDTDWLESLAPEDALRITSTILGTRPELNN